MTIHVVASGSSASHWKGQSPSIAVNDAAKWGYPVDYLILVNTPSQFQFSRLEDIKATQCKKVYTNSPFAWKQYFGDKVHQLYMNRWSPSDGVKKNKIYHSSTSPFVAISLAYSWDFTKIILWGVDFMNHPSYGKGTSKHTAEMLRYQAFFKALEKEGVKVYLGATGSVFENIIPIWNPEHT